MQNGLGENIERIAKTPELAPDLATYINRLNALSSIKDIGLHIEEVTGEDKTVDGVVDIFNRVNSGGTKLSKGDLALAKICAEWPQARDEMQTRLRKYERAGFNFKLDWLLRNVNTIVTGEAMFSFLKGREYNPVPAGPEGRREVHRPAPQPGVVPARSGPRPRPRQPLLVPAAHPLSGRAKRPVRGPS
jgi:hypothetical protein